MQDYVARLRFWFMMDNGVWKISHFNFSSNYGLTINK